jgi:pimeloyl-ACP methyl ester carboxylesterase
MIVATLSRTLRNATLLLFVTATWLAVAQSQQDRKIDIGECRLHIVESGTGAPAVVFESGLGEDVATWADVQPKAASISRTVAYDRAGIGQSDPAKRPRTLVVMAGDLHSLLHAAKIPPPYILVGHSLGGTLVQVFAHSYPTEVAGLVLVDPEDRGLPDRLRSRMTAEEWTARQKALDEAMPKMPPAVQAEMKAMMDSRSTPDDAFPLPDVPVILLTGAKKNPEFPGNPLEQDLKLELHNELLAKIPGSKHILASNSRHYIQNDSPQLVIDAVHDIVTRWASKARPELPKK